MGAINSRIPIRSRVNRIKENTGTISHNSSRAVSVCDVASRSPTICNHCTESVEYDLCKHLRYLVEDTSEKLGDISLVIDEIDYSTKWCIPKDERPAINDFVQQLLSTIRKLETVPGVRVPYFGYIKTIADLTIDELLLLVEEDTIAITSMIADGLKKVIGEYEDVDTSISRIAKVVDPSKPGHREFSALCAILDFTKVILFDIRSRRQQQASV